MKNNMKVKLMGERAIMLEFEPVISEEQLEKLLNIKAAIEENLVKEKVEVINTYSSLLVIYGEPIENAYGAAAALKELVKGRFLEQHVHSRLFHIPVCYDAHFGLDLKHLSEAKKLSPEEIISLHSDPIYTVYFSGFLPGFLYLGGLPERLHFPRKEQPRLEVIKGAVGIGEKQTGIYPQKSPGGWQIIGNSPVPLFNKNVDPPGEISAGDRIKFYSISLEEHEQVLTLVKKGAYTFEKEIYEG